jgi:hypothetical protein
MVNPLMGAKLEPLSGLETGAGASAGASTTGAMNGSAHHHHHHLGFVKLELDPHGHLLDASDKDDESSNSAVGGGGKVEVKMEVLGELFGYGFGCDTSSLLSESESSRLLLTAGGGGGDGLNFGPPSAAFSPEHHIEISPILGGGSGSSLIRTVKVQPQLIHHHTSHHHLQHHHSTEEDGGEEEGGFPPVLSIPASFAGSLASPTIGGGLHISISPISQGADTTSSSMASPRTPPVSAGSASSSSSSQKKTVYTAKGKRQSSIRENYVT